MRKASSVLMATLGVALLLCSMSACKTTKTMPDDGDMAPPTYRQLVAKATTIFQEAYPNTTTILFTAVAKPSSGVAKTASDLTDWVFDAQLEIDGNIAALDYSDGSFGSPSIIGSGWIGLLFVPLPQGSLTLEEGIKVLNDQGYTQGFSNVSFGTPVYKDPQPMFWFCVDEQTQGVSASTGEFFPNLFPCSSGGVGSVQ